MARRHRRGAPISVDAVVALLVTKPAEVPPVGRVTRPALPPMEALYLCALIHWYRHRKKPPTMLELCDLLRRSGRPGTSYVDLVTKKWPSIGAVRRGLMSLRRKGYVRRTKGKFEVVK